MTGGRFAELFGMAPRAPESDLTSDHADLAASVQLVLEEAMLAAARAALGLSGCRNLCLAGGVALNCVMNSTLRRSGLADDMWIQPAGGDAGGALGAALFVSHALFEADRPAEGTQDDAQQGSLLGPAFDDESIESALRRAGLVSVRISERAAHHARVVDALCQGLIVGRFYGRMEFGPRALGARSILADPRGHDAQRHINARVKFRESWRPFAPAVLAEHAADWFDLAHSSPYMLFVAPVAASHRRPAPEAGPGDDLIETLRAQSGRSDVPAVMHVDGTARLQTVDRMKNQDFHELLTVFHDRTGCPMLVNTSFNVRGEPIVCTPDDAVRCFLNTGIDVVSIGAFLAFKHNQPDSLRGLEGRTTFDAD